ncbi:unnamed protein product, partial [Laminaria digitata]
LAVRYDIGSYIKPGLRWEASGNEGGAVKSPPAVTDTCEDRGSKTNYTIPDTRQQRACQPSSVARSRSRQHLGDTLSGFPSAVLRSFSVYLRPTRALQRRPPAGKRAMGHR